MVFIKSLGRHYLVVLKRLVDGDDIVGLVVPGHATHQADGQLVVLTVQLEFLLMLLAHVHAHPRPVCNGRGHAAHTGPGLALFGVLQRVLHVPGSGPRGAVHDPGSAHAVHYVTQQRVGAQFTGAGFSTLGTVG